MKTAITILLQSDPPKGDNMPETREDKVAKLLKKIEYAADCIEYDYCKEEAIHYLQCLHKKLSMHKHMRNDTQMLIQKCYQLIKDYGILPISPEDSKERE